MNSDTVTH